MSLKNYHQSNNSFSPRKTNLSGTDLVAQSAPVRWHARMPANRVGMRESNTSFIFTPSPQPSPSGRGGNISLYINGCKQKGITLVGALFIIVIMALLGTGLLQLTTTSQQSIGQEMTSVRTYFAAQSALQWGMYQATFAAATGTHTLSFNQQGLANTRAITTLSASNIDASTYYRITADARYGNSGDREYSRRQLLLRYRP